CAVAVNFMSEPDSGAKSVQETAA
ncbi:phage tail protein, partial [Escherichia coli O125:H4]|nr:phage tail protein [Escherichia coli]ELP8347274.1 phage tail protein [Escherichia coli]ELV3780690.1 phage tail protein [Escherichia coli]HCN2406134.1 phage tail protein [Escherichia coli]HCO8546873.1 phage tail protein [Escherichia coli]